MGHDTYGKPLSPKIFILLSLTIDRLQLGNIEENNFMVGVTKT